MLLIKYFLFLLSCLFCFNCYTLFYIVVESLCSLVCKGNKYFWNIVMLFFNFISKGIKKGGYIHHCGWYILHHRYVYLAPFITPRLISWRMRIASGLLLPDLREGFLLFWQHSTWVLLRQFLWLLFCALVDTVIIIAAAIANNVRFIILSFLIVWWCKDMKISWFCQGENL